MIRLTILYIAIGVLSIVAMRRWFWALCGLLFVTVLMQNPSMPTKMFGIQGLNPWNALFLVVVMAWFMERRHGPDRAPTNAAPLFMVLAYTSMLVITGLIAVISANSLRGDYAGRLSAKDIGIDTIVNPLKYLVVGYLFYDGALRRTRVKLALICAVGSGLCYSLLMFKTLREKVFTIDVGGARRATDKLIGLFANDLAEITAFSIWGALLLAFVVYKPWEKAAILLVAAASLPAFLALKSRAGFLAFVASGLLLGMLRYRILLLALPLAAIGVGIAMPDVADRVLAGVGSDVDHSNFDEISSGRTTYLWPASLEQIAKSPIVGHGRYTILRTDAYERMIDLGAKAVPQHPHSAYLEVLLDAGGVGLAICLLCFFGLGLVGWQLLRYQNDRLIRVVGAIGLVAVATEMSAAIAGSSFYPTQSAVPYLCVWGVMLRVRTEQLAHNRRAAQSQAASPYSPYSEATDEARAPQVPSP